MPNIYESMTAALREHWKAHENVYPQRFELTPSTRAALVAHRTLVNETMNFKLNLKSSLGDDFLGVPIVESAAGDVMVSVDGVLVPINN